MYCRWDGLLVGGLMDCLVSRCVGQVSRYVGEHVIVIVGWPVG